MGSDLEEATRQGGVDYKTIAVYIIVTTSRLSNKGEGDEW